ncbi:small integral membrane protein 12 [Mixophyes fleayi]|uniref:small integral membrane protein 12 n=1 Tax=Mixophyes fleayi TaxID=3061075 RepID=UPI003F4E3718
MLPILWALTRTYAPYITLPVAFVVGAVGYHLERFIRGSPQQTVEEQSILEKREERALQEAAGCDPTKVISLKEKLEFKPKAVLYCNRQEKS